MTLVTSCDTSTSLDSLKGKTFIHPQHGDVKQSCYILEVDCWTRFIQDLAKVPSEGPDVVMNTCSEELDSTCII